MFVVCGEALFDLFAGEGPDGLSFDARIGGSPFNVAVGLARLGQRAALLTGMSTDPLGGRLVAALAGEGVETSLLVRTNRPTTLSLVDVGPDGGPAYTFYGSGAADRALDPDDVPELDPEVWGLHFGSYSLVVEPVGGTLLGLARREARRRLVTLDPNVRPTIEPDLDVWRKRIDAFAATADLVKVSSEDLALLYPGQDLDEAAARWLGSGAAVVVVTLGPDGALALTPSGRIAIPGVPVMVADTVGAGDTFQAALVTALAETGNTTHSRLASLSVAELERMLRFAATAAALTCGRRGADLPRRNELPSLN
ncbi:MAG TPA: carbohydrate kinase [Thermohalobaculum sp.]|nr:carbohydrate kinase [Thermohalobaculum sp.]